MPETSTGNADIKQILNSLQPFEWMPPHCIEQMLFGAQVQNFAAGDAVIVEGEPSSSVFVILKGEVEIYRRIGERDLPIARREAGAVVGEMGVMTGQPRNATVRSRGAVSVLSIDGDAFVSALKECPEAMLIVLSNMAQRLQAAEVDLVHTQKMASLGVLAAGLAHELNNPAAALERSAHQLRDAVLGWNSATERLVCDAASAPLGPRLEQERIALLERGGAPDWLNPLERSDREQAVQARLLRTGVRKPWKLAPSLVDLDIGAEEIDELERRFPGEALAPVLHWMAAGQNVIRLLHTLSVSANAISDIVTAVKAYTRLDQAPVQHVDVNESIDQALTILRSKLRSVKIHRDFGTDVPEITAYAGELNQVWTNLIDNAVDAMESIGELTIRTKRTEPGVAVEFIDTGVGMTAEVLKHLFDPFFTTKPPGKGTGLGLAITYSIVRRHGGTIHVSSQPGHTQFTVHLPISGEANGA